MVLTLSGQKCVLLWFTGYFCIPSYHSLFLGKEVSRRLVMTCIIPLLLAMYHYLRLLDVTRLVA